MTKVKASLVFIIFSGIGWLIDLSVYSFQIYFFNTSGFLANFISAYAGVTFVWFTSLRYIFKKDIKDNSIFLLIYWIYQFVSILFFSKVISILGLYISQNISDYAHSLFLAKIIATPINLLCNLLFMKYLINFMAENKNHDDFKNGNDL